MLICQRTKQVLCVHVAHGRVHDLKMLRQSGLVLDPNTLVLADKGYLGFGSDHVMSRTPHRKPRNGTLTQEQKRHNRVLAGLRMNIEHVIRQLKVFRVLSSIYRNRRRRFGLRLNLIAALCNMDRQ